MSGGSTLSILTKAERDLYNLKPSKSSNSLSTTKLGSIKFTILAYKNELGFVI